MTKIEFIELLLEDYSPSEVEETLHMKTFTYDISGHSVQVFYPFGNGPLIEVDSKELE